MKKHFLKIVTGLFFLGALTLNVSTDSKDSLSIIKKANAQATWIPIRKPCPGGLTFATLCGAGGSGCSPTAPCPNKN